MKTRSPWCWLIVTAGSIVAIAWQPAAAEEHPKIDAAQGWKTLFDGKNLTGWEIRTETDQPAPPDAWAVEDGCLVRKGKAYIRTAEKYGDFILDLEFKVGPGANSGILLRHNPEYAAGTPKYWWNGLLEVQLFDSAGKEQPDMHGCGALYDMLAPSKNTMKPAGQWNRMTITARGSKIAVVLNGAKVIDADLERWTEANKNPDGTPNKYNKPMKDVPRSGYIWLQEHPGSIWFRNIYIRPL